MLVTGLAARQTTRSRRLTFRALALAQAKALCRPTLTHRGRSSDSTLIRAVQFMVSCALPTALLPHSIPRVRGPGPAKAPFLRATTRVTRSPDDVDSNDTSHGFLRAMPQPTPRPRPTPAPRP